MDSANTARAERVVLILARFGRDAALASAALRGTCDPKVCTTAEEVSRELASSAAALIAEEALDREGVRVLKAALRRQATWSDFPFIVLTSHAPTAGENRRTMTALADLGTSRPWSDPSIP